MPGLQSRVSLDGILPVNEPWDEIRDGEANEREALYAGLASELGFGSGSRVGRFLAFSSWTPEKDSPAYQETYSGVLLQNMTEWSSLER